MYFLQPACSNKNYWFSASVSHVKVNVTLALLSEGAGSMFPGLAIILHLKYDKKGIHNYQFVYFSQ